MILFKLLIQFIPALLFSQTGSEIVDISEKIGRWPDVIITNSQDYNKINNNIVT